MPQPHNPAPLRADVLFAIIPEWVLFHPGLTSDDVRVYGVLHRHADKMSRCFPGQTLLAQQAHISVRTVRSSVERLEEAGAVSVRRRWTNTAGTIFYEGGPGRAQTSSEYVLRAAPPPQAPPARRAEGAARRADEREEEQEQVLGRHVVPGVRQLVPGGSGRADIPSWEVTR